MTRLALTLGGLIAVTPALASAQARVSDQLALARVAASEEGLLATEDAIAAIGAVLRSRCNGCTIATVARQYSTRVFDLDRRDSRAWVAFLRADGREPEHWPAGVRWSAFRDRWLWIYETAGRFVRGEIDHRCDAPVHHWGGDMDTHRAVRAGWERVECGDTANTFWRVPTRRDGEG